MGGDEEEIKEAITEKELPGTGAQPETEAPPVVEQPKEDEDTKTA
jgi:hypothetical protein